MAVVFTDSFTVGADISLSSYPSGAADYALIDGQESQANVNAANDRVQVIAAGSDDNAWRIIDAAVPTGDQECTVSANDTSANFYDCGSVIVRGSAGGNYYLFTRANSTTVELYRIDSGAFVLLTSASRTTTNGTTHTMRLKATGTGATVSLEAQIDATAVVTASDSNANRKTSGTPGLAVYSASASLWIDDLSVDDLTAGGSLPPISRHPMAHLLVR